VIFINSHIDKLYKYLSDNFSFSYNWIRISDNLYEEGQHAFWCSSPVLYAYLHPSTRKIKDSLNSIHRGLYRGSVTY